MNELEARRITELEHKVAALVEAYDNLRADYDKMRAERDRLLSERSVRQEPVAEFRADENGYVTPRALSAWDGSVGPLYAAPVAQDCVSVPREQLIEWASYLSTRYYEHREQVIAQLEHLLAASKEPKT